MSEQQKQRVDALMRGGEFGGGATPAAMRAGFQRLMAGMAVPAGIVTADREIAGRPALEVLPDGERHPGTILYFHGGAFIFGDPRTALGLTAALVVRTGVAALSLDYRLAPEHPFPAAIEDGVAAYRALLDAGADPASVAVAGDSAGGALTITTLLAARDAGLPMPACAVAFSPSLDATRSGASMSTKAGIDPVFTREGLRAMEGHYQAGHDRRDPLLSPALTADPAGLPPLLLQAGSHEVLLDDAVRFAARAAEADVDVILDVTAGVPHVFQSFQGVLDEADAALDRAGLFLRQHLPR